MSYKPYSVKKLDAQGRVTVLVWDGWGKRYFTRGPLHSAGQLPKDIAEREAADYEGAEVFESVDAPEVPHG